MGRSLGRLVLSTLIVWAALAIHHSNVPWAWVRIVLEMAFVGWSVWALWIARRTRTRWAFAGACLAVIVWFASIRPSHDRPWRPEVSVMPRATIDGDHVAIDGVRNFDYRSVDDFTARYERRAFSISRVTSVDLFLSTWDDGLAAHTFVSFNFDDGTPPLCMSIEARPEVGEEFAALPALFKRFELICVVGDERDLVGVRAAHRGEEVYHYPTLATPLGAQRLLRAYLDRINALAERPEFYHLLKNNCTLNIVRHANTAGRTGRFDVRHVLNGWADRYLYASGWVDTSLPFDELRSRARITDKARAARDDADFSRRIRRQSE